MKKCRKQKRRKSMLIHTNIDLTTKDFKNPNFQADIVLYKYEPFVLEGKIKYCDGSVASGATIKLFQWCQQRLIEVGETISDNKGYYKFKLEKSSKHEEYKIGIISRNQCQIKEFQVVKKKEYYTSCYTCAEKGLCATCEHYDVVNGRCRLK